MEYVGGIVIVKTENEAGEPSSSFVLDCCVHFTLTPLGKGIIPFLLPPAMGLIAG